MKAERDFKLVCTGGPYGDCCCSYAVELRGEWTVQELVKAVLERNPCEYPHLETEEQIKTALTRLLHKNRVSTADGRRMAAELAESYEGMYSHSDRSEGPASGHESHSSQPVT